MTTPMVTTSTVNDQDTETLTTTAAAATLSTTTEEADLKTITVSQVDTTTKQQQQGDFNTVTFETTPAAAVAETSTEALVFTTTTTTAVDNEDRQEFNLQEEQLNASDEEDASSEVNPRSTGDRSKIRPKSRFNGRPNERQNNRLPQVDRRPRLLLPQPVRDVNNAVDDIVTFEPSQFEFDENDPT